MPKVLAKDERINLKYNQIRKFNQYKNNTDDEVFEIAKKLIAEEEKFDVLKGFDTKHEKRIAKELLIKYLEQYDIESLPDQNSLKELIYYEIVQVRLQEKMNKLHKDDNAIPANLLEIMHDNSSMIIELKNKLGLNRGMQAGKKPYDVLEHLKKRFAKWRQENSGSRHLICPHCSKMVMLKIRMDAWEALKHPFFQDRVLSNRHLINLYINNKLTKDDVANVLEVSPDYVDWLISKWATNPEYAEILKAKGLINVPIEQQVQETKLQG